MDLWEHEKKLPSVNFKAQYVVLTGDIVSALVLSQIVYWFRPGKDGKPKLTIRKEGKFWLAKSHLEWQEECGISRKQLSRSLEQLIELGLITVEIYRFNGAPTGHINLKIEALKDLLDCSLSAQSNVPKGNNPLLPKGTIHCPLSAQSYGKTTTETTAEITFSTDESDAFLKPNKTRNGNKEMPNATEVLLALKTKPNPLGDKEGLSMTWKKEFSMAYEGFAPGLTMKEQGQLSQVLKKCADKKQALECISYAIRNWQAFTWQARADAGLSSVPEKPTIGFLLVYVNTVLQMLSAKTAQSIAPVGGLDKPEPLCNNTVTSKNTALPEVASATDIAAALAALNDL